MRAAGSYVVRCLALRSGWFYYDEWAKQAKYLYMVHGARRDVSASMDACSELAELYRADDDTAYPRRHDGGTDSAGADTVSGEACAADQAVAEAEGEEFAEGEAKSGKEATAV